MSLFRLHQRETDMEPSKDSNAGRDAAAGIAEPVLAVEGLHKAVIGNTIEEQPR